jgi:hypothetical protein
MVLSFDTYGESVVVQNAHERTTQNRLSLRPYVRRACEKLEQEYGYTMCQYRECGHFSSGFDPGIGSCDPGTDDPDHRQIFLENAQILSIIAKITHSLA